MRLLPCLSLLIVLFAAAPAGADDMLVGGPCAAPADCPLAFSCESVELDCEAPTTPMCECSWDDCTDGEDCPPCDCEPSDDAADECETTVEQRCVFVPQDCSADSDCTTTGFVCHEMEECSGSGGSAGCVCPPCDPDGGECPPCECDEEPEEVEECITVGGYCLPPEQPCATDADCGNGWECADVGGGGDRSCGCDCPPCVDGADCPPCECNGCDEDEDDGESMSEGMCLPPGWADQLDEIVGGIGSDEGGSKDRGDDQELGSGAPNDGQRFGDDDEVKGSSCAAAGGGAGASALLMAAALVLVLRRR